MSGSNPHIKLPSEEELTVRELKLSSPILRAGGHHFGKQCDEVSKEFMLCFIETRDPRKCLREGEAVTKCGFKVFNAIKDNCRAEFEKYWRCVDNAGRDMDLTWCRKTQKPFDQCVLDKLGWERPPLGYFTSVRLHETSRPKPPEPSPNIPEWIPGPTKEMRENRPPLEERRSNPLPHFGPSL